MQRTKSKVNSTKKRVKEKARQTLNIKTTRDILSILESEDIQMTSIPPNFYSPSPDVPSLVSSPVFLSAAVWSLLFLGTFYKYDVLNQFY